MIWSTITNTERGEKKDILLSISNGSFAHPKSDLFSNHCFISQRFDLVVYLSRLRQTVAIWLPSFYKYCLSASDPPRSTSAVLFG